MSFDLKIIAGDLSLQNGKLQIVENTEKLIQEILKIVLTDIGANPLNPGYGSYISRTLVGSPVYSTVLIQIAKSQITTCLENLKTLQEIQVQSLQVPLFSPSI